MDGGKIEVLNFYLTCVRWSGAISTVLLFLGCWAYCIATYGFLVGVGVGWLPSVITAWVGGAILAWCWPLLVVVFFLILKSM